MRKTDFLFGDCLFVCLFFGGGLLLGNPGWPEICDPSASIYKGLGLQPQVTMTSFQLGTK
jgi:hypothetical protein